MILVIFNDVVCTKKMYATVAAPTIDMAKISYTVNKLSRSLDTNNDVILDNNICPQIFA